MASIYEKTWPTAARLTYHIANNFVDFGFRRILSQRADYGSQFLAGNFSITIPVVQCETLLDFCKTKLTTLY